MKRIKLISALMAVVMFVLLPFESYAQAAASQSVNLGRGTTVVVKTISEIKSDMTGDVVAVVDENVYGEDGQTIVIEEGTRVVLSAMMKKNGALGSAGKIVINSATTTAVDGKTIGLTANLTTTGKGKGGLAWGLGIGVGIFCFVGLAFLFIKGGNATIPAGTYISGVAVDRNYNIVVQ